MPDNVFDLGDEWGPAKVLHIWEPGIGLRAIVVIDNVACGPAIGGCRMAPDVSLSECYRLARSMTLKNAAAGLPHGGGKSVIFADPTSSNARKQTLMRAFARAIEDTRDYIVGPDMGTNEHWMGVVYDEIGRAVGLPRELGGIPLDEIGATACGLAAAAEVAFEHLGLRLSGSRFVVQGFGAVGRHAARFLADKGAVLVAVADSQGAIQARDGIDVHALIAHKVETGQVSGCPGTEPVDSDGLIGVECELWIPAARPDVLNQINASALRATAVVPGANIAVTPAAEQQLADRGILVVPDFIANAGGVICASIEYHGGTEATVLQTIAQRIRNNTTLVLETARRANCLPREAADTLAYERVRKAMRIRRRTTEDDAG